MDVILGPDIVIAWAVLLQDVAQGLRFKKEIHDSNNLKNSVGWRKHTNKGFDKYDKKGSVVSLI